MLFELKGSAIAKLAFISSTRRIPEISYEMTSRFDLNQISQLERKQIIEIGMNLIIMRGQSAKCMYPYDESSSGGVLYSIFDISEYKSNLLCLLMGIPALVDSIRPVSISAYTISSPSSHVATTLPIGSTTVE